MKFSQKYIILLFFFGISFQIVAQNDETVIETEKLKKKTQVYDLEKLATDSTKLENFDNRKFSETSLEKYKNNPIFEYDRVVPQDLSWWEKFKMWLFYKLLQLGFGAKEGPYTRGVIYTISALVIIWAIIKIMGMDIFSLFYFKGKKQDLKGEWLQDNIHGINFDKEIAEAISAKNYKVAVRLFYLYTLKKLTDKELIAWEINKTNHDYGFELSKTAKGKQIQSDFEQATYYFEYVWYGNFKVNDRQFVEAQQLYQQFMKKL